MLFQRVLGRVYMAENKATAAWIRGEGKDLRECGFKTAPAFLRPPPGSTCAVR